MYHLTNKNLLKRFISLYAIKKGYDVKPYPFAVSLQIFCFVIFTGGNFKSKRAKRKSVPPTCTVFINQSVVFK